MSDHLDNIDVLRGSKGFYQILRRQLHFPSRPEQKQSTTLFLWGRYVKSRDPIRSKNIERIPFGNFNPLLLMQDKTPVAKIIQSDGHYPM